MERFLVVSTCLYHHPMHSTSIISQTPLSLSPYPLTLLWYPLYRMHSSHRHSHSSHLPDILYHIYIGLYISLSMIPCNNTAVPH